MLRILIAQVGQRIDGVAGFGHSKLHITCPEVKMVPDRQLHHSKSIKLMNQGLLLFEGILGADHKPDFIQVRALIKSIGNDQMPHVNWVEAPKVQPDLHAYLAKNSETRLTAS